MTRAVGLLCAALALGGCEWLRGGGRDEGDGEPPDPGPSVEAVVEPVLSPEAGDGHQRFYEVRFVQRREDPRIGGVDGQFPAPALPLLDVCRNDRFFVHFAEDEWPAEVLAADTFDEQLAALLTRAVEPNVGEWFDRPAPGDETLHVDAAFLCEAVGTIADDSEDAYVALTGRAGELNGRRIRVGRVCGFGPQAVEGAAGPVVDAGPLLRRWHLIRAGAEVVDPPAFAAADVLLVDTGVEPGVAAALEVETLGAAPGASVHHGTAMALLLRQLVPPGAGRLVSLPVFDASGQSTPTVLARALERGMRSLGDSGQPLIVNLSLGWPPELSLPRVLWAGDPKAPACQVLEDGIGEEVRYALAHAAEWLGRPVLSVAAAGNRPGGHAVGAGMFGSGFAVDAAAATTCAPGGPSPRWFFPGQWGLDTAGACPWGRRPGPLALAVGAVDADDAPSTLSVDAEPPLVAPGQNVIAWSDRVAPAPAALPACGPADTDAPDLVRLPMTVSGTSVAAALTSGVAALVQAEAIERLGAPLEGDTLARLIGLTATPLGRPGIGGASVQRVSLCRALTALRACAPLVACVRAGGDCDVELDTCSFQPCPELQPFPTELEADPLAAPACRADDVSPIDVAPLAAPDCHGADPARCPYLTSEAGPVFDRYSVGHLGPQPALPGCPDCYIFCNSGGSLDLYLRLNTSLPTTTRFRGAWLLTKNSAGVSSTLTLAAPGVAPALTDLRTWRPGAIIKITGIAGSRTSLAPIPGGCFGGQGTLITELSTTSSLTYVRDYSALNVVRR